MAEQVNLKIGDAEGPIVFAGVYSGKKVAIHPKFQKRFALRKGQIYRGSLYKGSGEEHHWFEPEEVVPEEYLYKFSRTGVERYKLVPNVSYFGKFKKTRESLDFIKWNELENSRPEWMDEEDYQYAITFQRKAMCPTAA